MFLLKVAENPATRRFLTRCIVSGGRKLTVGNEDSMAESSFLKFLVIGSKGDIGPCFFKGDDIISPTVHRRQNLVFDGKN